MQGIRPEIPVRWEGFPWNSWWAGVTRIKGPEPPQASSPGNPQGWAGWVFSAPGALPESAPFSLAVPGSGSCQQGPVAHRTGFLALDTELKASPRRPRSAGPCLFDASASGYWPWWEGPGPAERTDLALTRPTPSSRPSGGDLPVP